MQLDFGDFRAPDVTKALQDDITNVAEIPNQK